MSTNNDALPHSKKEAKAAVDEMLRLKPDFLDQPREFIGMLVLDKSLIETIMEGLKKAGLPAPD
jgi:hypothetical protein